MTDIRADDARKVAQIVRALVEATDHGDVPWRWAVPGSTERLLVVVGTATVTVQREVARLDGEVAYRYLTRVANREGYEIAGLQIPHDHPEREAFDRMWEQATRKALDVDATLDSLEKAIESGDFSRPPL